jgi:hypothetical protein
MAERFADWLAGFDQAVMHCREAADALRSHMQGAPGPETDSEVRRLLRLRETIGLSDGPAEEADFRPAVQRLLQSFEAAASDVRRVAGDFLTAADGMLSTLASAGNPEVFAVDPYQGSVFAIRENFRGTVMALPYDALAHDHPIRQRIARGDCPASRRGSILILGAPKPPRRPPPEMRTWDADLTPTPLDELKPQAWYSTESILAATTAWKQQDDERQRAQNAVNAQLTREAAARERSERSDSQRLRDLERQLAQLAGRLPADAEEAHAR